MATAETPSRTIAPPGIGRRIDPTIVAAKIASNRHDCTVIPAGTGADAIAKPTNRTTAQRINLPRSGGSGRVPDLETSSSKGNCPPSSIRGKPPALHNAKRPWDTNLSNLRDSRGKTWFVTRSVGLRKFHFL